MKQFLRYILILTVLAFSAETVLAQAAEGRTQHKVKRRETIFGIARDYGVTVEELIKANPEMSTPGYELRRGDVIFVPTRQTAAQQPAAATTATPQKTAGSRVADDVRSRAIRLGVMLPLHDVNGDGRRMVEYYRGVLMACDSLKKEGISVDVKAWNVPEDGDIAKTLQDPEAARRDLIIGPLYSKQVKALSAFSAAHGVKVLIPFSISAPELYTNRNLFQVYQSPVTFNDAVVQRFVERFRECHVVVVDCNDSTSTKGPFTQALRRRLEMEGIPHSITNSKSSESLFVRAFSRTKPNVVVLNTGRSPELNVVVAKLNNLTNNAPGLEVTLFGYTEWLMYTKYQLENFYKYNAYIPSTFYMNPLSPPTDRFMKRYWANFHAEMMPALPRFALTGFDHAFFFLRGLHKYGTTFTGGACLATCRCRRR